jgi:hypothetical protein
MRSRPFVANFPAAYIRGIAEFFTTGSGSCADAEPNTHAVQVGVADQLCSASLCSLGVIAPLVDEEAAAARVTE